MEYNFQISQRNKNWSFDFHNDKSIKHVQSLNLAEVQMNVYKLIHGSNSKMIFSKIT